MSPHKLRAGSTALDLRNTHWKTCVMRSLKYPSLLQAVLAVLVLAAPATATPWWVSYEGNDYPENEGWERYTHGGGAQRSLEDGCLVLDTMASSEIVDDYSRDLLSLPGPGEMFRAEWRLRVDRAPGWCDSGISVQFDNRGLVFLTYEENRIFSLGEGQWIATMAPAVFHEYALTSVDLNTYILCIDGLIAHVGRIVAPAPESFIGWGDTGTGAGDTSLTTWDFVRYGCVPEPSAGLLVGSVALPVAIAATRIRRR
jgi:hypothetical protein